MKRLFSYYNNNVTLRTYYISKILYKIGKIALISYLFYISINLLIDINYLYTLLILSLSNIVYEYIKLKKNK